MRRRRSLRSAEKTVRKPPTLADIMKIALLIHKDGVVWVIHDKALPDALDYVEYDADEKKVSFIGQSGVSMDLGIPVEPGQHEPLVKCEYLVAAHIENDEVKNMTLVAIVTRHMDLEKDLEK